MKRRFQAFVGIILLAVAGSQWMFAIGGGIDTLNGIINAIGGTLCVPIALDFLRGGQE